MQPRTFSILGVPIENLDSVETAERILGLIKTPSLDAPQYISTMNVDFLANTHGWGARHPELLDILRKSALVTADGMPIVWLSKCLGNPLKERVTGADLVPLLAEMLADKKYSIYLLGGEKKVAREAAKHLQRLNPGLKVAGIASPPIHIQGEHLVEALQRDELLLEEIHKVSPDLLLICLGHPKQEIWFERIRHQLRVPVAIGIGGTLNFLTGKVKRAPPWMQSLGLEWLYRFSQEPRRLLGGYLFNAASFLVLSVPLILLHRFNELFVKAWHGRRANEVRRNLLFLSPSHSIALVRLPTIFSADNASVVSQYLDEAFAQDALVLDFRRTRHIDLEGLGILISTWKRARNENKNILAFGVTANVRLLMRMHKVWDLLHDSVCSTPHQVVSRLQSGLYEAIQQSHDTLTLSLFGKLNNTQDFGHYLQKLLPMVHQKNCTIDCTYCDFIDNAGFCVLQQLQQHVEGEGKEFKVRGLSRTLARQFRLTGL